MFMESVEKSVLYWYKISEFSLTYGFQFKPRPFSFEFFFTDMSHVTVIFVNFNPFVFSSYIFATSF